MCTTFLNPMSSWFSLGVSTCPGATNCRVSVIVRFGSTNAFFEGVAGSFGHAEQSAGYLVVELTAQVRARYPSLTFAVVVPAAVKGKVPQRTWLY
jgi:hypothetical protein